MRFTAGYYLMQQIHQEPNPTSSPDILQLLNQNEITPFFQQVVCVSKNCVCGLEGLIRGRSGSEITSPKALFEMAEAQDLTLQLDRLCRERVLSGFSTIYPQHRDKLLFINIEAAVLDKTVRSGYFNRQVAASGIAPGNIVVEINETKVKGGEALKDFIHIYRDAGFLIALDDVGAGFSNLDRIPVAKPDIIKIDISLVRNIHCDYHRQEVFKSLVGLAGQIGAMVVAEGVETEDEALQALKLGAHMIQGFYFSRPKALGDADPFDNPLITSLAERYKASMMRRIREEMDKRMELFSLIKAAVEGFDACSAYEQRLRGIVAMHIAIECAYVLDEAGTQCCEAVFHEDLCDARRQLTICSLSAGTDHSMKSYYYRLMSEGLAHHITEPYVSPVTGSLCVTVSMPFGCCGSRHILCLDLRTTFKT